MSASSCMRCRAEDGRRHAESRKVTRTPSPKLPELGVVGGTTGGIVGLTLGVLGGHWGFCWAARGHVVGLLDRPRHCR